MNTNLAVKTIKLLNQKLVNTKQYNIKKMESNDINQ